MIQVHRIFALIRIFVQIQRTPLSRKLEQAPKAQDSKNPPLPLAGEGWGEGKPMVERFEQTPSSGASRHLLPQAGEGEPHATSTLSPPERALCNARASTSALWAPETAKREAKMKNGTPVTPIS